MKAGWIEKALEDCFKLKSGDNLTSKMMNETGVYPVFGGNGIAGMHDKYNLDSENIIVGRVGALCGNVRYITEKIWLTDNAFKVVDMAYAFDLPFLTYLLNYKNLRSYARQAAQPVISNSSLKDVLLQFPKDINEQQRIVAILDEAFAGIATAKANAEQNLKNARELFESHLILLFPSSSLESESATPLSDLCELIVDCEHKTAPTQKEGYPSIRTPNIGKGRLILEGVYKVSEITYEEWTRRAKPQSGDLILAREAPAGNVAVIPDKLMVCLGQRTVLIRPRKDIFNSEFLMWLLLQSDTQKRLLAHSRGATVQHVNMKDIRALGIGLIPSIKEQKYIVEKIKSLVSETQRLENIYQQKIAALDELKKALLHKAFSGEL